MRDDMGNKMTSFLFDNMNWKMGIVSVILGFIVSTAVYISLKAMFEYRLPSIFSTLLWGACSYFLYTEVFKKSTSTSIEKSTFNEAKGMGGWLIVFVIAIFLRPLMVAYNISINFMTIIKLSNEFPFMLTFYTVGKLIDVAICFFGFYVAYCLFKTKINAPSKAKLLILFSLIQVIFLYILPLFYGLPTDVTKELLAGNILGSIGVLLFCLAWYLYFTKSKRVKNTFLNNQVDDNETIVSN